MTCLEKRESLNFSGVVSSAALSMKQQYQDEKGQGFPQQEPLLSQAHSAFVVVAREQASK